MKMEPIVRSETSAIRTQTPGNYPKRNNLHLEHGESLRTRDFKCFNVKFYVGALVDVIIKVIQNARCNNKDTKINPRMFSFHQLTSFILQPMD